MSTLDWTVTTADVARLRALAQRVRAIADGERNQALRRRWYAHDEAGDGPPLLLTETDGGLSMVIPDFTPQCVEPWAQAQEWGLMAAIVHAEIIRDDVPIEPWVTVGWQLSISDYGVPVQTTRPQTDGFRGAYHIDVPLPDLARDIHRLRPRTYAVDRAGTRAAQACLKEVYDGILGVRLRGNPWWTLGLTWTAINHIGLEGLMLCMYDQPEALHRLMAFLRDETLALLDWLERQGLLHLNNENDYIGSGSRGYTRRLPVGDAAPVRTPDLWTLIESQETVGVGPDLYEEFIFPYENRIAQRFGGVYYGCCEPVHTRWSVLRNMANLRRVSISAWCDEEIMGEALGRDYVYSRKPNPTLVSTEVFDEAAIRADIRRTLAATRPHGCRTEIIMKDVHTLNGQPDRLTRWVQLAREEIER